MARRPKTNVFEDLVAVFALLPWLACLALSVVSYVVLHALAPAGLNGGYRRKLTVGIA